MKPSDGFAAAQIGVLDKMPGVTGKLAGPPVGACARQARSVHLVKP